MGKIEVSHSIFLCNFKSLWGQDKNVFLKKVLYLDFHFCSHLKGCITSSKKPPKTPIYIFHRYLISPVGLNFLVQRNPFLQKQLSKIANKHRKRCLTPLVIRDMQIKTTMRYCYIPTRLAKI